MDDRKHLRHLINLMEAEEEKLILSKLSFDNSALSPVMSKETIDNHYDILTKNYYKNANKTGDAFQVAGAYLHGLFWEGLKTPVDTNNPRGRGVEEIFRRNFGGLASFKKDFGGKAIDIQGNGWIVLTKTGKIVEIPNHKMRKDIILILDMWEHAYYLDYKTDKKTYVDNFWKIVDWDKVNERLES